MKKFLMNTVIAMFAICFILNIVNLIDLVIEQYTVTPQIVEVLEQRAKEELSKEEKMLLVAATYSAGYGNKMEIQAGILGVSLIYGIIIGLMVTFEKESKTKLILGYVFGLLLFSVVGTLFYMTQNIRFFFSELLYNIERLWKWYTLIFAIIYIVKIYISNKYAKKLNEILKEKKAKNDE